MNRNTLVVAALFIAATLPALNASAASNGTDQYKLTIPVVELNNPCTPGHDSIDGTLDLHIIKHRSNGTAFIQVTAQGAGVDGWGTKYNLGGKKRIQVHDILPASAYLSVRLISQGSGDNAFAVYALHVNEQGVVTKAEFSGVECLG